MRINFSGIRDFRPTFPVTIILAFIAFLIYANALQAPFVFDDLLNITLNHHIRLNAITADSITNILDNPGHRFVADLTMALNYYFHGQNVMGFHMVNIIIHIITALLVFRIGRETLRLCGRKNDLSAFLAAVLWLVNPVHTQSVTYTVQRMNSLAAMFFLLALFCYIQARIRTLDGRKGIYIFVLYLLCLINALLGLASKENAAALPLMLLLYEWYFFQHNSFRWLVKQAWWIGLAVLMIFALAFFYLGASPVRTLLATYHGQNFTMGQRLLTEPAVVIYYFCLLLFPHPNRLKLLYDFPVSSTFFSPPSTILAIMGVFSLIAGGIFLSRKQPLLSFAVFWFLGTLIIESTVLGLSLIFEHRTYLPSIFLFIALTELLVKPPQTRVLAVMALLMLIVTGCFWTCRRNYVWDDTLRFWHDNAEKSPNAPKVNNNLGQALLGSGENEQAAAYFKKALKYDPYLEDARVNLGVALERLGRPEPAEAQYRRVLAMNPANTEARFNLALELKKQGDTDDAVTQLEALLSYDPDNTIAMLNLGATLMGQGKNARALNWLQKAASLDSKDTRIINNLGLALSRLGRNDEALTVFRQGLSGDSRNPILHNSLGLVLLDQGRYTEATREFKLAVAADPDLIEAHNNLGLAAERQGETEQAIKFYNRALEVSPAYELARYNLATLLLKTGQPDKAFSILRDITSVKKEYRPVLNRLIGLLMKAQELRLATLLTEKMAIAAPDDAMIYYNLACLQARQGNVEKAEGYLKIAIDLGYDDWNHLKTDADLDSIRQTEYYKNLVR